MEQAVNTVEALLDNYHRHDYEPLVEAARLDAERIAAEAGRVTAWLESQGPRSGASKSSFARLVELAKSMLWYEAMRSLAVTYVANRYCMEAQGEVDQKTLMLAILLDRHVETAQNWRAMEAGKIAYLGERARSADATFEQIIEPVMAAAREQAEREPTFKEIKNSWEEMGLDWPPAKFKEMSDDFIGDMLERQLRRSYDEET